MSTEAIIDRLDQLDRLDQQLRVIRSAPVPLEQQLVSARTDFDRAAATFKAAPWSQQAGIKGALAVLLPKETARFELDRIRQRAAADPREALDHATRRSRTLATEAEISTLLAGLSPDDLVGLEQTRDHAHAVLRGLTQRRDEVQARCDLRVAAMAMLEIERESEPSSPPEPRAWPGYDQNGEPRLEPPQPPRPLSAAERGARDAAIVRQLADEATALDRDKAALAATEAECSDASARWRRAAAEAERCARWLRRKPIPARAAPPLAAE